jgi:tRNA dimethylallyltransferase
MELESPNQPGTLLRGPLAASGATRGKDVPKLALVAPLVAIAGPTGSGKSELALALAEAFRGEVINCDSLQVYRHFDLGTAKLSLPDRRGIPHHLIDTVNPDELFTAGEYARRARVVLGEISRRHKLPIIVGGTGFYLRALLDGLFAGPERNEDLRERLARRERRRPASLHRILRRLDPAAARNIHPSDVPKVTRALEVCILTRRRVSELFRAGRAGLSGYRSLKLGLDPGREALYARVDDRCRRMFESGLVDEVKRILALGYSQESKPFESHGYKQALQVLRGELTLKEAIFYAQRNTRRYAKRQMTWFRQESGIVWLKGFGEEPGIRAAACELVREFLTN